LITDTGPLVALFDRNDKHHEWAVATLDAHPGKVITCEAVIAEASYLLKREYGSADPLLALIERGLLNIEFDLALELHRVRALMARYADLPASLADTCLVRMSEIHANAKVLTLDQDFTIYRRHGRQAIALLSPF
jgi:uncharacterized protein